MFRDLKSGLLIFSIITISALVAFTGCSTNSSVNSNPDQYVELGKILSDNDLLEDEQEEPESPELAEDEGDITAASGGNILIDRDLHRHTFEVDPEAIEKDTRITVKSKKENVKSRNAISFEFGPSGLTFTRVAKLDFDMTELNPNAESAKFYYYDPQVNDWLLIETKLVRKGRVIFNIYHFSKYAISD